MFFMESDSSLAVFIRAKMKQQNLSAYDVARNAGNEISPTTITKILNGEVNRSGAKTLALIGKGLGVTEIDMFRVARGDDVSRPLHYQIYAERLDGADIEDGEWQFIEQNFRDYLVEFRAFKERMKQRAIEASENLAPVVAHIGPADKPKEPTRAEVQKMIDGSEVKPRKRKAG